MDGSLMISKSSAKKDDVDSLLNSRVWKALFKITLQMFFKLSPLPETPIRDHQKIFVAKA